MKFKKSKLAIGMLVLCGALTLSGRVSYADTLKEIQQEKEAAQKQKAESESKLESVQSDIEEISEEKEEVESEIAILDELLFDLLLEVDLMKADIADKNDAIAVAKADLEAAIIKEQDQKEAMAKRIKYMYEKGNESYLVIFLESKSMADAINKVEYTEKLYEYDRILLEKYQLSKQEVIANKARLETELNDLEEMEEDLEIQQQNLNDLIEEKQRTVENFTSQLISAKARASAYEKQIKEQSDNLKNLNAKEQAKIAEEARKRAEEEAKRKAEEAAKKKALEDAKKLALETGSIITDEDIRAKSDDKVEADSNDDKTSADGVDKTASDASKPSTNTEVTAPTASDNTTGTTVTASGSGIGAQIANYGLQFVGNPYVSGGTSLTNGCDCSGFTQGVYSHFGISIPRSSYSQSSGGVEVPYSAIQAGDIIYYGGHVAIYIGNDKIVHASTPSTGIKVSSAFYRSIITVRRYY